MISHHFLDEDENYECELCGDTCSTYNTKLLPCQHAFCFECLPDIQTETSIICSVCNLEVKQNKPNCTDSPRVVESSIKEIDDKDKKCIRHNKDIILPLLFCSTCKTKLLCEGCLDYDHYTSDCKVISYNSIKKVLDDCKETVKKHRDAETNQENNILQKIKEFKLESHRRIDKEYEKIEKIVRSYFSRRDEILNIQMDGIDDYNIDRKDLEDNLIDLSKQSLKLENPPEIIVKFDMEVNNFTENIENNIPFNKCLIKLQKIDKWLSIDSVITDDGIYYLKDTSCLAESNDSIYFKSFNDLRDIKINLNRNIRTLSMTRNYIYATGGCRSLGGPLFYAKRSSGNFIALKLLCGNQYLSIKAIEDDNNQRYAIAKDINRNICFFINEQFKWKFNAPFSKFFITNNGNPIVFNQNKKFIQINKSNTSFSELVQFSRTVKEIQEFSPYGILLLMDDIYHGKTVQTLYIYDYKFMRKHKLITCKELIGTSSSSGLICVSRFGNNTEVTLFKINKLVLKEEEK